MKNGSNPMPTTNPKLVVSRNTFRRLISGKRCLGVVPWYETRFLFGAAIAGTAEKSRWVEIDSIRHCLYKSLTEEDALAQGSADLDQLKLKIEDANPDITPESLITLIGFVLTDGGLEVSCY